MCVCGGREGGGLEEYCLVHILTSVNSICVKKEGSLFL